MFRTRKLEALASLALLAGGIFVAGCGMPGAPMPPTLNLPQPVADLHAERTGAQVALSWSMPRKNTDKLLLKEPVTVKVCRAERDQTGCATTGELRLEPGTAGRFIDTLSPVLASGTPRSLVYFLEVENRRGRSAGPSNRVTVLAGAAPPPVEDLTAEVRKAGVVLRWRPEPGEPTPVRLRRKLLTPAPKKARTGLLDPSPEPLQQNLLVGEGLEQGRALDKTTSFGMAYEYQAQRVARVRAGKDWQELEGALSAPVRVEVKDVFPPDVPEGLVAVAMAGENGLFAVDLNWQPNREADLAGYIVYRREGTGEWRRVSPAAPLSGLSFRDATVAPGHGYQYAVSAVDQGGHEGARSAVAEEMVPAS
jgi:hypothetical protein